MKKGITSLFTKSNFNAGRGENRILNVKDTAVHFCWRVPEEFIKYEQLLQKKTKFDPKLRESFTSMTKKLFEIRVQEYEKLNNDTDRKKWSESSEKFTTLPSYDYRLHPNQRNLFIEDDR